jgi:hypothetical protein
MNDAGIPSDTNGKDEHVFKVFPTNSDDTENLLKAFAAAKKAGPGSTIQLMSGKFFIRPIEVLDFEGYFQGYGRGITLLHNLPDIPCDYFWNKNNVPFLIQFVGGKINISDITIQIKDGPPCSEQSPINRSKIGNLLGSILVLADYTADYTSINNRIECTVTRVDFIAGHIGDGSNPDVMSGNVDMAIYCGSPEVTYTENSRLSEGVITIIGCSFEQNVNGLYLRMLNENSIINSTANVFAGNVYQNFILSCSGSKITISKNSFLDGFYCDIMVDDNDYGSFPDLVMVKSTEYTISDNYFKAAPQLASLYLLDIRRLNHPDEGFPQLFNIISNTFHIHDGGAAIVGVNSVGANINDNFFDATGTLGAVIINGDEKSKTFARNVSISGNTFENTIYSYASIFLGAYTTDCNIVCEATDKVVNKGINNSVSGSKSLAGENKPPSLIDDFTNQNEKIMRMNRSGVDMTIYPTSRTYTFGVDFTF